MTSDSLETCFMLMHCNFKTGPFHTYPFLFEMDIYVLCSLKSPLLYSALFIFYLPVHTKKQKLLKTVPSLVGACTFTGI